MFIFKKHISRRTVLKGAGVTLALPFLEAMVPAATALAQTAANPKIRAGFFYIPHGAVQFDTKFGPEGDRWTPSGSGASFKLNTITRPLEPFKRYVSTIGNLENPASAGSVHIRNPGYLVELQHADHDDRSDHCQEDRSGHGAADPGSVLGNHDPAGGRQRHRHGAHDVVPRRHTPLPMEYNPKKVFNSLFGSTTPKERVLNARESDSLLDLILDRTKAFQNELGAADRATLDEYLESVREIERRIAIIASTDISSMKIPERPVGGATSSTSRSNFFSI